MNPEQHVLDAIDALEHDEIAELVTWQLEEGRRRGDGPAATQMRTNRAAPRIPYQEWFAPADAPYRDHVQMEPGDRVGWVDADGALHVDAVREHREDPPGSDRWTITIGNPPAEPRTTAESVLAWLGACFPDGNIPGALDDPAPARGDSSSAPRIDTIDPANGEQPRR